MMQKIKSLQIHTPYKYIYTTLIANDDYILGALGLNQSLKKHKCQYPFIPIVTSNCSEKSLQILKDNNISFKFVLNKEFQRKHPTNRYKYTINKFYLLTFQEYEKICFLDADALVIQNIDFLFNKYDELILYRKDDGPEQLMLMSGTFFIVKPSLQKYNFILQNILFYHEDECLWSKIYPFQKNSLLETSFMDIYYIHDRSYPKYFMKKNWKQTANNFYFQYTNDILFKEGE